VNDRLSAKETKEIAHKEIQRTLGTRKKVLSFDHPNVAERYGYYSRSSD
jgi:hypothetical protein